jgi:hypothetical protein
MASGKPRLGSQSGGDPPSSGASSDRKSPDPKARRSASTSRPTSWPSAKPWVSNATRGRPLPQQFEQVITVSKPSFQAPLPWRAYQQAWILDPNRLIFAVKSAQVGFSTASAAWAIGECMARDNHLIIILSRSEPQSKELARKAKQLVDSLKGIESQLEQGFFRQTMILEHSLRFPNGSRIIALSSNPETARGYTGDVVLDEFGFHPDSEAIFKAAYRQITLGHKMRILSTPNGQRGKFYQMAKEMGATDGIEPPELGAARAAGGFGVIKGWSSAPCATAFRSIPRKSVTAAMTRPGRRSTSANSFPPPRSGFRPNCSTPMSIRW